MKKEFWKKVPLPFNNKVLRWFTMNLFLTVRCMTLDHSPYLDSPRDAIGEDWLGSRPRRSTRTCRHSPFQSCRNSRWVGVHLRQLACGHATPATACTALTTTHLPGRVGWRRSGGASAVSIQVEDEGEPHRNVPLPVRSCRYTRSGCWHIPSPSSSCRTDPCQRSCPLGWIPKRNPRRWASLRVLILVHQIVWQDNIHGCLGHGRTWGALLGLIVGMTVGAVGAIVGSSDGTVAALQVDDWIVIHIVDPCMGGVSPTVSRTGAADLL